MTASVSCLASLCYGQLCMWALRLNKLANSNICGVLVGFTGDLKYIQETFELKRW
jgi:hypothetical protein